VESGAESHAGIIEIDGPVFRVFNSRPRGLDQQPLPYRGGLVVLFPRVRPFAFIPLFYRQSRRKFSQQPETLRIIGRKIDQKSAVFFNKLLKTRGFRCRRSQRRADL
jgi:hypothetical protein